MQKTAAVSALLTVLLIGGLATTRQKVHADGGCSVASLKGGYSFSSSGFFFDNSGNLGVESIVGRLLADGSGSGSGTETASLEGTSYRAVPFTGTYTVNPDCTGSLAVQATGGSVSSLDFVITANGTMLQYVYTDKQTSMAGTAYQQGVVPSPSN
jgi:hypothetical protein